MLSPLLAQDSSNVFFKDQSSGLFVPFVECYADSDEIKFSKIDGRVRLKSSDSILASHPLYESFVFFPEQDSVTVFLKKQASGDLDESDDLAVAIIKKVAQNCNQNNIFHKKQFSYRSYNKATIEADNIQETEGFIQKILDVFSIHLENVDDSRHLILAESVTKRDYLDEFDDKEVIEASQVSGIDNPRVLTLNSQLHSISLYNKYIRIVDKSYLSPLYRNAEKRYDFVLLDSIVKEDETLYRIKFNPNGRLKEVLLSGVLYISSKKWGVKSAVIFPDKVSSTEFQLNYDCRFDGTNWVPESYSTTMFLDKFFIKDTKLNARFVTHVYDFSFQTDLKRSFTDDIAIEYLEDTLNQETKIIEQNRKENFSQSDKDTYKYYKRVGSLDNIDQAMEFAEHLYSKEIKMKYFNFDLNRAFDFNQYEGLRVGLGVNKTFFEKKLKVGGHAAYGLNDDLSKGGVFVTYKLLPLKKLEFFAEFNSEIYEAAGSKFPVYNYQYSTEWLRRFSLQNFDYSRRIDVGLISMPLKYCSVELKYQRSNQYSLYDYQFKNQTDSLFKYSDVEVGFKFALGESFFRLYENKYAMSSHFPKMWFKFNLGNKWFNSDYRYFKVATRIEYSFRSFLLGKAHIQMNMGYAQGELPYFQLYEGYGANGAAVAHNRFETMRINEFLSNVYFNTFFTYELAKLYFRKLPNFRPSVELSYNYGIGALSQANDHSGISFKTMEKSYHEAGLALRDVLTFKVVALKVGLGYANYFRIGAYAYDDFKDNYVGKLIFTFAL